MSSKPLSTIRSDEALRRFPWISPKRSIAAFVLEINGKDDPSYAARKAELDEERARWEAEADRKNQTVAGWIDQLRAAGIPLPDGHVSLCDITQALGIPEDVSDSFSGIEQWIGSHEGWLAEKAIEGWKVMAARHVAVVFDIKPGYVPKFAKKHPGWLLPIEGKKSFYRVNPDCIVARPLNDTLN